MKEKRNFDAEILPRRRKATSPLKRRRNVAKVVIQSV
jgi:hypothetical protein